MIIAAFGDSIMEGRTGISPGESWFTLLQSELGGCHTLVNAGVGGNSAREAFARWEKDVLSHSPDFIMVELGGNNHDPRPGHEFRRVDDEEFLQILKSIRASLPENFPVCALTFPPIINEQHLFYPMVPGGKVDEELQSQRQILRDFARENNWEVLDLYEIFYPHRRELILPDGIHLNPAGHRLLKEVILKMLKNKFPENFNH